MSEIPKHVLFRPPSAAPPPYPREKRGARRHVLPGIALGLFLGLLGGAHLPTIFDTGRSEWRSGAADSVLPADHKDSPEPPRGAAADPPPWNSLLRALEIALAGCLIHTTAACRRFMREARRHAQETGRGVPPERVIPFPMVATVQLFLALLLTVDAVFGVGDPVYRMMYVAWTPGVLFPPAAWVLRQRREMEREGYLPRTRRQRGET